MATVRKRTWTHNGKESTAWVVAYTDQGGKRRIKTFDKKKDADRYRTQVESEIEDRTHVAYSDTITIAKLADLYLAECERRWKIGDLAGATVYGINGYVKNHVVPNIGAMKAIDVRTSHVQEIIDKLSGDYSLSALRNIYISVLEMLNLAKRRGVIGRNVLRDEPVKFPKKPKSRVKAPSKAMLSELLASLDQPRGAEIRLSTYLSRRVVVSLGMFAGLRAGEMCGLQWENVDFLEGQLHIQHSFSRFDGLKAPKTEAGLRTVDMTSPVRRALEDINRYWSIYDDVHAEMASRGGRKQDCAPMINRRFHNATHVSRSVRQGHVLRNVRMKPYHPVQLREGVWYPLMKDAGLVDQSGRPLFGMHALRHAAVSLLIESGLPAMNIQNLVGHASVKTTLTIYGHLFPEDDRTKLALHKVAGDFDATTARQIPIND